MELVKEFKDGTLVVKVKGEIDTVTAPTLEKEVGAELGKAELLILDFKEVNYVSSAGLRVILALYKKQGDKNRKLELVNVNTEVMTVLEMTGFTSFLTIK